MCPGGCGFFQGLESAERVSCKGIWEEEGRSCGTSVPSGKETSTALPLTSWAVQLPSLPAKAEALPGAKEAPEEDGPKLEDRPEAWEQ